jgi:hypothetical protein
LEKFLNCLARATELRRDGGNGHLSEAGPYEFAIGRGIFSQVLVERIVHLSEAGRE